MPSSSWPRSRWASAAGPRRPTSSPLDRLLREPGERDRLAGELAEHGLALSCVNAAGNPLHPDPAVGPHHAALLRGAVELAALLGVDRVVTMSGCPGGRERRPQPGVRPLGPDPGRRATLELAVRSSGWRRSGGSWGAWARESAPSVLICLELHAGRVRLQPRRRTCGSPRRGATTSRQLRPQPLLVAGHRPATGARPGRRRVGFPTPRTRCFTPTASPHGVFDFRFPVDPETALALRRGRRRPWGDEWSRLLAALRSAGYDGDVSIEHEDPRVDAEEGIRESHAALRAALAEVAG